MFRSTGKRFAQLILPKTAYGAVARFRSAARNLLAGTPARAKSGRASSAALPPETSECGLDARRAAFRAQLLAALPPGCCPFEGGSDRTHRIRFNFPADDQESLLTALAAIMSDWSGASHFRTGRQRLSSLAQLRSHIRTKPGSWFDLRLEETRAKAANRDVIYYSVLEFAFWEVQSPSYKDTPPLTCDRGNEQLHPIRPGTFAALTSADNQGAPRHLKDLAAGRDLAEHPFSIDVVYTWVDDQDPRWLEQKLAAQAESRGETAPQDGARAFLDERFTNRNELLYSLRSLELYAPFVRHVYLVTAGQHPDWLAEAHPRLTVVDHKEIYSCPDGLPVFNSSSIETQLHHIPGLSEHFLYMNDDFFFGQLCQAEDFFHSNGIARLPYSDSRVSAADIDDTCEEYVIADKNALNLFEQHHGFRAAPLLLHSPYPARVSLLNEMEQAFAAEFEACARQKFRSKQDLRPIAFMFPHYAYAKGLAVPHDVGNRYLALWKETICEQLDNVLKSRKYKTFCINDVGVPEERKEETETAVRDFLQNYFPRKSSFEK